jgi:predicted metal-binding membrane protein
MGGRFRSIVAVVLAFALVMSAGAWSQCTAMQLAAADIAAAGHDSHHMHSGSAMHDHHAMHHEQAPAKAPADDHACMKCCAMCMMASATLPAAAPSVIFTITPAAFFGDRTIWSGSTTAVDPGIPKRIA